MNPRLKQYCVDTFGVAKDADEATFKSTIADKLKSGELSADKYAELLAPEAQAKDKAAELADTIAAKTASALNPALAGIAAALEGLGKAFTAKPVEPPKAPEPSPADLQKQADDAEARLKTKLFGSEPAKGGDGSSLMGMSKAFDETTPDGIRVKSCVEQYAHSPQTLVYKSGHAQTLGLKGQPILYGNRSVNMPTERTQAMSAVWAKFQMFPELINDREKEMLRYILNKEKFHLPSTDEKATNSRLLTEAERHDVMKSHMDFYRFGVTKASVIDETGASGGAYAVPEFFDMDMIVTPTLAGENIPSYCNVVPVPRGSAAQNFIIGRPTIAAANTEGSAVSLFTPTGFITNHDTTFYRAAGFISLGRNYIEDAHPGLVAEIQNQYMNSVRLWFNEQIMAGDGSTEPEGVLVASGTVDVTPATPTTSYAVLADVLEALFAVPKAFRQDGGRGNAIFVMTDTTYSRIRAIATGVTGDTRLVFGDDVENYRLFNHPVLIEENGMTDSDLVFMQAKGYRLYLRQGARFIREDRGDTLVRSNTFIVGVDVRAGGQLDQGSYAAVIDSLKP